MPRSPNCRSADLRRRGRCAHAGAAKSKVVFELKAYHHNVPDAELLADLRRVARRLGAATVSVSVYERDGRFAWATLAHRFGGWNRTLLTAGLKIRRLRSVPAERLLADLRRVARRLKVDRLKRLQYIALGRYTIWQLHARLGSWDDAVAAAGLEPAWPRSVSTDQLLSNLENVWRQLGRQPTQDDMCYPVSRFSMKPYVRRFGTFRKALEAFVTSKAKPSGRQSAGGKFTSKGVTDSVRARRRRKTSRCINWRLRFLTMQRDGFRCRACGASPSMHPGVRLEVDHIVAWSNGGESIQSNLQTLCQRCNSGKSNLKWRRDFRS